MAGVAWRFRHLGMSLTRFVRGPEGAPPKAHVDATPCRHPLHFGTSFTRFLAHRGLHGMLRWLRSYVGPPHLGTPLARFVAHRELQRKFRGCGRMSASPISAHPSLVSRPIGSSTGGASGCGRMSHHSLFITYYLLLAPSANPQCALYRTARRGGNVRRFLSQDTLPACLKR